ncbi:nucleotide-binding protein [Salmonella enterica]
MSIALALKQSESNIPSPDDEKLEQFNQIIDYMNEVEKSWSGSWLGYQSCVYYENLAPPPLGAHFNKNWGFYSPFQNMSLGGAGDKTVGDWVQFDRDELFDYLLEQCDYSRKKLKKDGVYFGEVISEFNECKDEILSIYHANKLNLPADDYFLTELINKIESLRIITEIDLTNLITPRKISTQDTIAGQAGIKTPPHISVRSKVAYFKGIYKSCDNLRRLSAKLRKHINNIETAKVKEDMSGVKIFIGHGRSPLWRELKDFIHEKLHLPYEEFNRTATAGLAISARLSQMLDASCFAFLVMTAEDENADGNKQARMNVIHEVGLFQGRLGFEKAIVLLEDGCEPFSNIDGIGQIRFPAGNIQSVFQNIREVLEREKIIES